ncbi:hypothetical protein CKM354_001150100 [Cercospora kikuchii]|uniref:Uncharacterized protein n=1 Tax=Cercospora kikuchii TaxID=84275 RepID=A0A9P3CTR3_9PEZI|nr:uncharacterized protein CKM354_001150100 [Cercospora kikuchii]GIZ48441.1 hypothetical protein CKM354_001150100 [Cercospora kikuchii]
MQFTTIAFSMLCSALFVAGSEVNGDDIPDECRNWTTCEKVTSKAASCGGTREWGDVFSQPDWISCACNQIGVWEIEQCVSCVESVRTGGDILQLDQACKDRKY